MNPTTFNQEINDNADALQELSIGETEQVAGGAIGFVVAGIIISGINAGKAIGQYGKIMSDGNGSGNTHAGTASNSNTGFGSDLRLKCDVTVEGELVDLNITVYSWEYKDHPGERFVGVMAQDLLAREDLKSSVFTFTSGPFAGFYGVDYASLGLRCLPFEAWDKKVESLVERKLELAA